jgi:hypothetical protein
VRARSGFRAEKALIGDFVVERTGSSQVTSSQAMCEARAKLVGSNLFVKK